MQLILLFTSYPGYTVYKYKDGYCLPVEGDDKVLTVHIEMKDKQLVISKKLVDFKDLITNFRIPDNLKDTIKKYSYYICQFKKKGLKGDKIVENILAISQGKKPADFGIDAMVSKLSKGLSKNLGQPSLF